MLLSVNLAEENTSADPAQVCRTCTHAADHTWRIPFDKMVRLRGTPELERLLCDPTHADVPLVATSDGLFPNDKRGEGTVHGMVASCGQQILKKCTTCARFVRVVMDVPYQQYADGPTRFKAVTVGGHCSIPAEGIEMDGKQIFCDHRPRSINIDPSCLNCANRMTTGPNWWADDFDRDVAKVDLTPYEMHVARVEASLSERPIPFAITDARVQHLTHPAGIKRWYRATLLERIMHKGKLETYPIAYRVRFLGSGEEKVLPVDDPFVHIHDLGLDDVIALEIMLPHQRQFGYTTDLKVRRPVLPELPGVLDWAGEVTDLLPFSARHPERIEPTCSSCHTRLGRACHYHALAPTYNALTNTTEYADPYACVMDMEAHHVEHLRSIHLVRDETTLRVVNALNQTPHPTVFRARLRSLYLQCNTVAERNQVMAQYFKAIAGYSWTNPRAVEVGFGAPMSLEPFKSYCSLNLPTQYSYMRDDGTWVLHKEEGLRGRDFRAEFGDEFGVRFTPQGGVGGRTFFNAEGTRSWVIPYPDRSWAEWMDREEYLRAQVNERQFAPVQGHLEQLTNLELMEDQGPRQPFVEPQTWKVTRLDMFGEPVALHDAYDATDERKQYRQLMDETRIIRHNDDQVTVSEMMLRHGIHYAMGNRAQMDPAIVFDNVELDTGDSTAEYICVMHPEEHRFSPEKIDAGDFTCPICDADLAWHESGHEDLPARQARDVKGRVGIGIAVAVDRSGYQEQTRLIGLLCDEWMLRGSSARSPMTLDRLQRI